VPAPASDSQTNIDNNSSKYTDKLVALHDQLPGLLEQYKKDFVLYNVNPTNSNNVQSIFFSDRNNIQTAFNNLFAVIQNIQKDLTDIDASTNILNSNIQKERTNYKKSNQQLALYNGKIDTAGVMKDDYTLRYFNMYVSNITLFIGICLAGTIMFRVFRKSIPAIKLPQIPSIPSIPTIPSIPSPTAM
jgi:hypothetical protein